MLGERETQKLMLTQTSWTILKGFVYWSQYWVNWFLIWPVLIQPWVDQNFLVSIDPKLEWIGKKFQTPVPVSTRKFLDSSYQSQSRGISNFLVSFDPNLEWIGKKISNPSPSLDQKIFGLQVPIPISRWFQIFLVSIDPNLKEITNFRANFLKS